MTTFHSLTKNSGFREVYNLGKSYGNKSLIMYIKKNEENQGINRVGISVSKKVGNSVVRHRVKRRVREIFRVNDDMLRKSFDIVVVARVEAKSRTYGELERDIFHLLRMHHIVTASKS